MRISLFGGGTDFPSWFTARPKGGSVLGFALNQYCWITLRQLPPYFVSYRHRIVWSKIELVITTEAIEHPVVRCIFTEAIGIRDGLEVHHVSDIPARSGVGSSSAFAVGLINAVAALRGQRLSPRELASAAIEVERIRLAEAGGWQDQLWAAHGGLARIDFNDSSYNYRSLIFPPGRTDELLSHLMLFFTGLQRNAHNLEAEKTKIVNVTALDRIRASVDEAETILTNGPLEALGPLLDASWAAKRGLAAGVSTGAVDALYGAAKAAGATGGKLLGAGGGGFVLLFVPPERKTLVREALRGFIEVPVGIAARGSEVVVYD